MANEYVLIATGHNNAAGFVRFKVAPWMPRIVPGVFRVSLSLTAKEDGSRSVDLIWSPKIPNAVKVDALTKCGLASTLYANVTVRLPTNKDRTVYSNFNGTAFWNEAEEYERRGSALRILIYNLVAI